MSSCLPFSRLFHRHRAPSALSASGTPPPGEIHTYTYSTHSSGVPLKVDVHLAPTPSVWPSPTVFFFHGGNLLFGDRTELLQGLKRDVAAKGWTLLSYDYLKLVPCTAADILQNLNAAYAHYHTELVPKHNLSAANVFFAGYSAGGYVAMLGAMHLEPKPLGVMLVAAQGGMLLSEKYYQQKKNPMTGLNLAGYAAVDGYFGDEMTGEGCGEEGRRVVGALNQLEEGFQIRMELAVEVWRRGVLLDLLTAVPGLSAKLRALPENSDWEERAKLVPESARAFLPELLIDETFPPAYIVYGTNDRAVFEEEALGLVKTLKAKQVPLELVRVEGASHQMLGSESIYWTHFNGVMDFFEPRLVADEEEEEDLEM